MAVFPKAYKKWTGTQSAGPELQNYNFLGYAFMAFFLPSLTLSSLTRSSCSDSGAKARKQRRAFSESVVRFYSHKSLDYSGTDSAREPGALPAEKRIGWGRYPLRVRIWYFLRCSPTSFTVTLRQPRFGFACG